MDCRDSEVQDDLDLVVREQLFRSTGFRHVIRIRLRPRVFEHEVRAGDDFDVVEYGRVFEVDAADLAATDYSYFDSNVFGDGEFLLV